MSVGTDDFRFPGVANLLQSRYWNLFPILVCIGFYVACARDV